MTPEDASLLKQAQAAWQSLLVMAREDCALFCELVLQDEESGERIQPTPMHEEWHQEADKGHNMVIWAFPGSGKSQQFSIGRSLWKLGRNSRLRGAILSAGEDQSKKVIGAVRRHIETNKVLHQIFPKLKRGKLWTDTAISIDREGHIKDPSLQAISENKTIQGARLDFMFIDDLLVEENTRTAYQRAKTSTWVRVSAFSRLSRHAQIIVLANAFHPADMAHELARQRGWWAKKYPIYDAEGNVVWDRFSKEQIQKIRDDMGEQEFARMYLCQPRSDEDARFKQEWIDNCLARGDGYPMFGSLQKCIEWFTRKMSPSFWSELGIDWDFTARNFQFPPGFLAVTGVDLAVSKASRADYTVIFTALFWPDGTRQILNIQRGRWKGPDILRRILRAHKKFRSLVIVENNAAQDFIVQWLHENHENKKWVKGFRTGKNKTSQEFGVESIATELEKTKWVYPNNNGEMVPELGQLIHEQLFYSPDVHTGDCLMAQWMVREGGRAYWRQTVGFGGASVSVSVLS